MGHRLLPVAILTAMLVSACGQHHIGAPPPSPALAIHSNRIAEAPAEPTASLGVVTLPARLQFTPQVAEAMATQRAQAWQADAALRFVAEGVSSWRPTLSLSHVYYSPSAKEVLVVKTAMAERFQRADAYSQGPVALPASEFAELGTPTTLPGDALTTARAALPLTASPSIVYLAQATGGEAVWSVVAGADAAVVEDATGLLLPGASTLPFPVEWTPLPE